MPQGLFDDLRVIDCGSYIAGPAATTVMSDFGAEVIKIEPLTGDPYRVRGAPPAVEVSPVNPNWLLDARNKKSLALNIATDAGRSVLYRLVAGADVFMTNYPPKVRKRLQLTYDEIAPLNARVIYASLTGFGETGPDADKPGFDATAWWARTGMMDLTRAGDAPPVRTPPGVGDHPSAMSLYAAIVTALYKRERTGRGSHVGTSLLMNGLWANASTIQATLCGEKIERPPERSQHPMPWRNSYRCSDDKWLVLSIVHNDGRWQTFHQALQSSLLDDSRFQSMTGRKQHAVALTAVLDTIFATRTAAEWGTILDAHGVVFGAVAAIGDVPNDEQARMAGALVPMDDESMLTVSSPLWIAGEQKTKPKHAPALGQHSEEILASAGFSVDDVRQLRKDGVIA